MCAFQKTQAQFVAHGDYKFWDKFLMLFRGISRMFALYLKFLQTSFTISLGNPNVYLWKPAWQTLG